MRLKSVVLTIRLLLGLTCLLNPVEGNGQQTASGEKTKDELLGPWEFTPKVGYVMQWATGVEVGLFYGRGLNIQNSLVYEIPSYGVTLGGELLFYNGTTFFMPKVSAEYHSFKHAYGGRIDLAYYNVKGAQNIYVVPQAGLNFTSFLSLHVGYGIPVLRKRSELLGPFKISIYLNLPKNFPTGGKFWPG